MSDSRIRVPNLTSKMSSDDMNGLNSQLLFQDETVRFNCAAPQRRVGEPGPKTRELSGFIDEKLFSAERARFFTHKGQDFRRTMYGDAPERTENRNWNGNDSAAMASGKSSDEDDDEEEEDDDEVDDDGDGDVEGLVADGVGSKSNRNANNDANNQSGRSGLSGTKEIENGKPKQHSSFEMRNRDGLGKDGAVSHSGNHARASPSENNQLGRLGNYSSAVTIAESDNDMYYTQFLQGAVSSASGQKDSGMENGCGFSRRKDVSFAGDSGDSLRAIFSDPVTGALMEDAMILPCGHSFGSGGIQHITRMKACYTCSVSISEDSIAPNLSLRAAVQAFRREEELQLYRSPKRRKERFDQDKNSYGDITLMDQSRGRGVQFPFSVTDRVIIKGNKRTPQRFVGREAIVTTQCLNGWYVVKTLDNAESVKLQYRSLARVAGDPSSTTRMHSSKISPNWL